MLQVFAAGRLGKDAEIRQAGRDSVCSFSIATSKKVKGEEKTVWLGCSLWGKRGEALVKHLTKGSMVVVAGELSTREHNGKTYLDCRVSELTFGGGNRGTANSPPPDDDGSGARVGFTGHDYGGGGAGSDDEIPFAVSCFEAEESWW